MTGGRARIRAALHVGLRSPVAIGLPSSDVSVVLEKQDRTDVTTTPAKALNVLEDEVSLSIELFSIRGAPCLEDIGDDQRDDDSR